MAYNISQILRLPLIRNTLKLSSSSAFLMFIPLVVTPILSRLYTPEDYGDWGVFSSVLYIVTSFMFLSYENTIVKTDNSDEIPSLVALCVLVSGGIVFLTFGAFAVGKFFGITFFCDFPCLHLLILILLATAIHTICNNLANRDNKYGVMAVTSMLNGSFQAGLRILLGFFPIVSFGLITGNVLAQIIATVFLLIQLRYMFGGAFLSRISFQDVRLLAAKYKKFPIYDAPARFIELSIANIALIILSLFWSKDDIGSYSMVVMFLLMPISLIGSAMSNVYYREISENIKDAEALALSTKRVGKITFSLSVIPLLFLSLGGDRLLVLFLGEQWYVTGRMALCLVIFSVPVILSEPLLPIFRSLNKQEQRFKLNLLCLTSSIGGLLLASYISHNIYISLITYSLIYAGVRYLMFFRVCRLAGFSVTEVSKHFYVVNSACYLILFIRILFEFI